MITYRIGASTQPRCFDSGIPGHDSSMNMGTIKPPIHSSQKNISLIADRILTKCTSPLSLYTRPIQCRRSYTRPQHMISPPVYTLTCSGHYRYVGEQCSRRMCINWHRKIQEYYRQIAEMKYSCCDALQDRNQAEGVQRSWKSERYSSVKECSMQLIESLTAAHLKRLSIPL